MNSPTQTAIQELREALGMSRRQAAREAGVDHTYLSRYELGQVAPSRAWVRRVSYALGLRVAHNHKESA